MSAGAITGLNESQEQAVRAELNRLLESPAFRTSKRCREFLEYVIEHTLNGPSGTLKERSIGVELFQLPQDFDSGQHTIVRVTANEVRKKLAQYYQSENGAHHAVQIEMPPGAYGLEFRWSASPAEPRVETPVERPAPQTSKRFDRRWIIVTAVALLVAGAFYILRLHAVTPVSAVTKRVPAAGGVALLPIAGEDLRMMVGATNLYVDRSGRSWLPDRFFTGGTVLNRSSSKILRTLDPDIYRHPRQGDFRYDIPLKTGAYELHLHFAETGLTDFISAESSGEGQRLFRVFVNGKQILNAFDIVADADGANVADERVFRDISPAEDGFLHLSFASFRGAAMLNAIEVLRMTGGKLRPVRVRAGWLTSWQDPAGEQWQGDSYFLGGNALVRTTNPARASNAPDAAIFASERWGHFSYAIPAADSRYRVTLRFSEGHYGPGNIGVGGIGSRLFDVFCNGVALLRQFDIFKTAGGEGRPIERTFSAIRPNAQGKINLSFVPVAGMACVNGIEVVDDGR